MAKAKVANEQALTANPEAVKAYVRNIETYLRGSNSDLTKEILNEVIVQVRISPGTEPDTISVAIQYRIPSPPKGRTAQAHLEELLLRKNERSLSHPARENGGTHCGSCAGA